MTKINNVHDKYFRAAFSILLVAKEFIRRYLPAPILTVTDLSTLKLQKESFISESLSQRITDVLYQAKINGKEGYIYFLVEHQSTPDKMMAFRVLDYTCQIMKHHVEDLKRDVLPVVVPLVFYHGKQLYSYSNDIFDLFGDMSELAKTTLLKPFNLIDVNKIPDEELKKETWAGVLTFMQKHIYARDVLKYIHELMPLFKELMTLGGDRYIMSTLHYAVEAGSIDDIAKLAELTSQLSPKLGDEVMTLADRLRDEGMERGRAEGKAEGQANATREVAMKMLAEGVEPAFVARVTGLSSEIIDSLVVCVE